MKKNAPCFSACPLLAACQSGIKKGGTADAQEVSASAVPAADGAADGRIAAAANQMQAGVAVSKTGPGHAGGPGAPAAKLLAASDCASCHQEREKLVGPAYAAIAQKYPSTDATVAMLAGRIITGGKGHWGQIPMTPHSGLSLADAKEMAQYILSLK